MSYAAPLAYAAKAISHDPYGPPATGHHPRPTRRRRIRMALLPALRPRRRRVAVPAALAADPANSR